MSERSTRGAKTGRIQLLPAPLQSDSFRRYWIGMLQSVGGYRIFEFTQFWLAYEITRSALFIGVLGAANAIPAICLNLIGGAAADRFDRRQIIIWTESTAALVITGLAMLVAFDQITPGHLLTGAGIVAGLNAFNQPARHALYPRYVERDILAGAVALNSAVWQVTRIIGPALAGAIIAVAGTSVAFAVAAAGMISMALIMRTLPSPQYGTNRTRRILVDVVDGLRYVGRNRILLFLMAMTFFNGFFAMSYIPLMPVFAVDILDVGADGQGLLLAISGIGSLVATAWIATRSSIPRRGLLVIGGATLTGGCVALFSLTSLYLGSLQIAGVLMFAIGIFSSTYMISVTTFIHLMVDDNLRGRIMGLWSMTWSLMPMGALFAGALASLTGVPWAVALGGLAVAVFAVGPALMNEQIRRLGSSMGDTTT